MENMNLLHLQQSPIVLGAALEKLLLQHMARGGLASRKPGEERRP